MELRHFERGAELIGHARAFLAREEVRHALLISVATSPSAAGDGKAPAPWLVAVEDKGAVVGVALRTPPRLVVLSELAPEVRDEALALLIADLRAHYGAALPGSYGPRGVADVFAERWARATGGSARVWQEHREFELDALVPPRPTAGAMRLATTADMDVLAAWLNAFVDETGLPEDDRMQARPEALARRIDARQWFLWEAGGRAVTMALGAQLGRVGRVGFVYTPGEQRRRGYASALTAAVSRRLLDEGCARCSLATDASNPTSNKIYQALGYRFVGESVMMRLE